MASRAYQLSSIRRKDEGASDKDDGLFSQMQLKPMTPEQLFDSLLDRYDGASRRLGATTATGGVTPGCGSSSSPSPTTKTRNRPAFKERFPRRS